MTVMTRNRLVTCGGGYTGTDQDAEPLQVQQGVLTHKDTDDKPKPRNHAENAAPLGLHPGITGSKRA